MTNKNIIYIGAAFLTAGLFMPIVKLPIVGSVNLFSNGTNELAVFVLVLAVASAILAASGRLKDVLYPAAAASLLLAYSFIRMEYGFWKMRQSVAVGLKDNPFGGLAQTALGAIQLQWGWLVLALGAGILVYVAVTSMREGGTFSPLPRESTGRTMAALSLILLLVAPASDLISSVTSKQAASNNATAASNAPAIAADTTPTVPSGPGKEEAAYIKDHLKVYDLSAKYRDSLGDGRVPGVDFKLKNDGNRTLAEVDVRVLFYDASGKAIAEDTFYPVLTSSFSSDSKPLRPNYIWQQESDKFYSAKDVPSEWSTGKVSAVISDIKFAPNE